MKMHALVRFGKWQQIADAPMPENPGLYCVSTSMHHYAKGVAYAALKVFDEAEEQKTHFYDSLQRISPDRRFFNNPALQTLGVGEKMLLGELEYHRGNHESAFDHLREAVKRSDSLHYSEPWPWMHPPRHALGALLMEQGQHTEAEKAYREDLGLTNSVVRCAQHPNNVWALHGLVECLTIRGEKEELAKFKTLLNSATVKADVAVTSSCCCREKVRDLPG
jgi:tetratricopeptide (TPR) repeat protein